MALPSAGILTSWPLLTLIVAFVVMLLKRQASKKIDPREPPVVPSTIPYVGHILGMLFYGSHYFKILGSKNPYPIFTLPNLNSRLYIVTEPSLAASVQRATKTLSFNPIVPPVLQRVPGMSERTADLIKSDMQHGFVQQVQEVVHSKLGQGDYLDQLTLRACNEFFSRLQRLDEGGDHNNDIDFLKWIKRLVTVSTAAFFYGPNNPVEKNPKLVDQFWDFDAGIPGLLVGIMPWLTARRAYEGREAVVKALSDYLESPYYEEAADITKERTKIAQLFGVDEENTARSDLTFFFAGIINTSLTSFWMVLHIFADPDLLSRIRNELTSITNNLPTDIDPLPKLSIKTVVKECSLLNAVFKEVLRLYSDNFATRVVLSDTLLADTYFLRAGSILQISGGIIHADRKIWGPDVNTFRPERFQNNASTTNDNDRSPVAPLKSVHPSAFRAFGGGATLCPGRHFALNEILGLVALMVLMLDIDSPGDLGSPLKVPAKQDKVIPIHVLEPVKQVNVRMRKSGNRTVHRLQLEV